MWQAADVSIQSFVLVERLNRYSPPHPRTDNLPWQNACLRSNYRSALHENVIAKSNLAADDAIIFDGPRLEGEAGALPPRPGLPDPCPAAAGGGCATVSCWHSDSFVSDVTRDRGRCIAIRLPPATFREHARNGLHRAGSRRRRLQLQRAKGLCRRSSCRLQ